jgi:photoactive yellow protein
MPNSDSSGAGRSLLLCAWCGCVMHPGDPPPQHGICPRCTQLDEPVGPLPVVSPDQLDRLPFGVIRLNGDGTITSYNAAEARHARREPAAVIGKNFFTEVAPCTAVQGFAGRLDAMRQRGVAATEHFGFVFRLPWTRCTVRLALTYAPDTDTAVVIVDWTPSGGAEA